MLPNEKNIPAIESLRPGAFIVNNVEPADARALQRLILLYFADPGASTCLLFMQQKEARQLLMYMFHNSEDICGDLLAVRKKSLQGLLQKLDAWQETWESLVTAPRAS